MVIYSHSVLIDMVICFNDTQRQQHHGMVVNYYAKKFIKLTPGGSNKTIAFKIYFHWQGVIGKRPVAVTVAVLALAPWAGQQQT